MKARYPTVSTGAVGGESVQYRLKLECVSVGMTAEGFTKWPGHDRKTVCASAVREVFGSVLNEFEFEAGS